MTPLDFLILTLATFYWAYSLVHLDMPFQAAKRFRENVTTFGGALLCFYCTAFWVALIVYALHYQAIDLIAISGITGAASFAYRYTGGAHG